MLGVLRSTPNAPKEGNMTDLVDEPQAEAAEEQPTLSSVLSQLTTILDSEQLALLGQVMLEQLGRAELKLECPFP
jgi:hypothetical protein